MSTTTDHAVAPEPTTDHCAPLPWHMRIYVTVLALSMVHSAALMTGATIIRANPSLTPDTTVPGWGHIIYYLATNLVLIALSVTVIALINNRRRAAILVNYALCALSIAFHVSWHLTDMKSGIGTIIDPLPNLVGAIYLGTIPAARRVLIPASRAHATTRTPKPR